MGINKDSQKVPKLRFKGFTDDWEQRKFETVIRTIQTGTNLLGSESNYGTPLIKMGNIQRGYFIFTKTEYLNENDNVEEKNMVKFGDFLFNTRNTLELVGKGATWFGKDDEFAFNSNIARFTFKGIDTIFFNYLYNTPQMIKQVQARAVGTTSVAAVYPRDLNSMKFELPIIIEQQKIGSFFKLLDNAIALHQRKLDQLKQLKEALLQQMFPGKGETVPKLRFAGFEGDWEDRKLGELASITTGKLDANAMVEGGAYDFYTSGIKKYSIDKAAFEGPAITIAGNGATVGYMHLADGKFNAYQRTYVLTNLSSDRLFTFYEISNKLPKKIQQEARTGNIPYIVMDMLTELKLSIPNSREQNHIGTFFKSLDNTITLQQRKLDQLKNMKQVLLGNMFI